MNEHEFQDALQELLEQVPGTAADDDDVELPEALREIDRITTFDQAAVLTSNAGLVVRTNDGSEFQITIAQSR